ncbi:hypothetical protein D5S18_12660 [Nocardia panacis]|uniref:Uncharacterized protein n=1 Tax=Nocardia panacis TaxID=2340916 RepID=A0A3A4JZU2_9NOCA|nr:hypothetical protein D5S18_12660 [Nocardia panacis]
MRGIVVPVSTRLLAWFAPRPLRRVTSGSGWSGVRCGGVLGTWWRSLGVAANSASPPKVRRTSHEVIFRPVRPVAVPAERAADNLLAIGNL